MEVVKVLKLKFFGIIKEKKNLDSEEIGSGRKPVQFDVVETGN